MRLEQHDIVTLDEAESVDSLTKKYDMSSHIM